MTVRKVSLDQIKYLKGKTKKSEVDDLTDKDINEAVLSDPDSVVPTKKELEEFGKPKERKHD
ncbi:hypothetical protein [Shewanella baltica]|uniref:hypothetical protein n=1 Tax=Shewanella baltica TaxID=62322 RepID=UPI00217E4E21|nr:hypothetical protein [Shewanella baltica]MCS6180046.1 hypothetical protein [Shewanella baltica]MCS6256135.1 hypothetical protein [Shewanella baltica]